MAETPNTATVAKNIFLTVTLEGDTAVEYAGHVSAATVTPSTTEATWSGGTDESQLSETITTGHTLALQVAQDLENPDALIIFLLANVGEKATFTYGPHKSGTFRTAVEATIVRPVVGGPVNAFNESAYSVGCSTPVDTLPA